MGTLHYGSPGVEVRFDDRTLMHLHIVITAKLRRREGFVFSWSDPADSGSGRSSIWIHPSIPLFYRFTGSKAPLVNRDWVDALMASANSAGGMVLTPEPAPSTATRVVRNT